MCIGHDIITLFLLRMLHLRYDGVSADMGTLIDVISITTSAQRVNRLLDDCVAFYSAICIMYACI